jgi:tRNA dimethylallyltransferase
VAAEPVAVLLMGPTASGKSRLALELATRLPLEIVSVDSAQVYRGMDIGTAKPSAAERQCVPHHLIDVVEPTEPYSAARFRVDALGLIHDIAARGRLPLLAGGTMLYFKALRDGLSDLPGADVGVRTALDEEARRRGWPALHADLARVDPVTAARLEPGDTQRIQRALEVYRLTGEPMSERLGARTGAPAVRLVSLALVPGNRGLLHRRIERRLEAMLADGLVDELAALRERHALTATLPSMRCVGYRQAWQYLEGQIRRAELRDRAVFATRQLAKRQLTWLRGWDTNAVLDCFDEGLSAKALDALQRTLDA